MTIAEIATLGGVAAALLTAIVALIRGNAEGKTSKRALDKQIDDRVAIQLKEAWDQLDAQKIQIDAQKGEIDAQKGEISTLRDEVAELGKERTAAFDLVDEIRAIVRRWVESLLTWHREGHRGDLPLPSDDDVLTLRLPRHLLHSRERQQPPHDPVD